MSKTKKLLSMLLVVALVAGIAISGTLAYLTSEDSDVNVMTLGNVKIAQHEYERVVDENGNFTTIDVDGTTSYELQKFTQGKPLYPVVGDVMGGYDATEVRLGQLGHNSRGGMQVLPVANVQDKFVVVENTGNSDAYVRTIVAFEAGSLETVDELTDVIDYSFHFTWIENSADRFIAEIDGNNYMIVEFVYNGYEDVQHPNGVLTPGDYTYNSLAQVYMHSTADNDDVDAIDGNDNGTYDILVFSQAVQAAGFEAEGEKTAAEVALDAAFGDIAATNHPWVNGIVVGVDNAEDLADALENAVAGETIKLVGDDFGTVEISGELNDVTIEGSPDTNVRFNILSDAILENVTFEDLDVTYVADSGAYVDGGAINIDAGAVVKNLVIEDCAIEGSGGRSCVVGISEPTAEVTIRNCEINNPKYIVYASAPIAKLTIEGCEISNISSWAVLMNAGDSVGAELTISGCTFTNCPDGIAKYLGSSQPEGGSTTFTNNTLVNCKGHDGSDAKWFAIPGASSTITVSGNTLDGVAWTPGTAQGLGK